MGFTQEEKKHLIRKLQSMNWEFKDNTIVCQKNKLTKKTFKVSKTLKVS